MTTKRIFETEFINVRCVHNNGYCGEEGFFMRGKYCLYNSPTKYFNIYNSSLCDKFKVDWITFIAYRKHLVLKGE